MRLGKRLRQWIASWLDMLQRYFNKDQFSHLSRRQLTEHLIEREYFYKSLIYSDESLKNLEAYQSESLTRPIIYLLDFADTLSRADLSMPANINVVHPYGHDNVFGEILHSLEIFLASLCESLAALPEESPLRQRYKITKQEFFAQEEFDEFDDFPVFPPGFFIDECESDDFLEPNDPSEQLVDSNEKSNHNSSDVLSHKFDEDLINFSRTQLIERISELDCLYKNLEDDYERRTKSHNISEEEFYSEIMQILGFFEAIIQGNLSVRGEVYEDVLGAIQDSLNVFLDNLCKLIGDLPEESPIRKKYKLPEKLIDTKISTSKDN